jgi:small-conductance mechanosensitive channel
MTASPLAPGGALRTRIFGRARSMLLLALLALLVLCGVFSWITQGAMANLAFLRSHNGAADQSLVDLRPWQTAQTLASLAVTAEESEYAREAERLADHEVDQAFAAALRAAELQTRHRVLTGQALALSQRIAQLQQEIAQDKLTVARVKAEAAAPSSTARSAVSSVAGSDALQVAEAQLGLDSDELTDAQRDLERATGNLSVRIQDELAAHEASMHKFDSQQQSGGQIAVVSVRSHGTLAGRLRAWFNQSSRYSSIEQALAEARSDASALTAEHNALEAKANAGTAAGGAATLAELQDRSTQREILSIDDDRIQTDQQLASVYAKWANQVLLQHRIILHLILQSLELILFIVLCMVLGDALVRRLMTHPSLDRRRTETLRTILEVSVQVLGVLLIVLVLFGPPHQTATVIGLATAALTISLQDYILAFLGWFMLVGKNGIRLGDTVEINGVCGEVVEVGLMSTTLLETTGLAEKGEPTGRRISFLNSYAIRGLYFNFSSEGQWLWDEITVSVPTDADIYAIASSIEEAAREETAESARLAEEEWRRNARSTGLTRLSAAPIVMMRPSVPAIDIATGIDIQVRYVTRAAGRFEVRDRLYRHVIGLLKEKRWLGQPESAAAAQPASGGE